MTIEEAKARRKVSHTRGNFAAKIWMELIRTFPRSHYISGEKAKNIQRAQTIYEYYRNEWCKTSEVL